VTDHKPQLKWRFVCGASFFHAATALGFSSIRPFDIAHKCRKDQPVITTTNQFAFFEAIKNFVFFVQPAHRACLKRLDNQADLPAPRRRMD